MNWFLCNNIIKSSFMKIFFLHVLEWQEITVYTLVLNANIKLEGLNL